MAGCATPHPVPFQIVDSDNVVHQGVFGVDNQSMDVRIGPVLYQGFYIVSTSVENTTVWPRRYGQMPRDSFTVLSNNSARAHLTASGGERLVCEFLFQGDRAIGECKSPQGRIYQLVAEPPARR